MLGRLAARFEPRLTADGSVGPRLEQHRVDRAHPFQCELPPGRYTFTVERGKEYLQWVTTPPIRRSR